MSPEKLIGSFENIMPFKREAGPAGYYDTKKELVVKKRGVPETKPKYSDGKAYETQYLDELKKNIYKRLDGLLKSLQPGATYSPEDLRVLLEHGCKFSQNIINIIDSYPKFIKIGVNYRLDLKNSSANEPPANKINCSGEIDTGLQKKTLDRAIILFANFQFREFFLNEIFKGNLLDAKKTTIDSVLNSLFSHNILEKILVPVKKGSGSGKTYREYKYRFIKRFDEATRSFMPNGSKHTK